MFSFENSVEWYKVRYIYKEVFFRFYYSGKPENEWPFEAQIAAIIHRTNDTKYFT